MPNLYRDQVAELATLDDAVRAVARAYDFRRHRGRDAHALSGGGARLPAGDIIAHRMNPCDWRFVLTSDI